MEGRRRVSVDADSAARDSSLFVAVELREVEASRQQVPYSNPDHLERYLEGLRRAGLPEG